MKRREHGPLAQLLIAWSPLSIILLVYAAADWVTAPLVAGADGNRLGFGLHEAGPAQADRLVFGAVPSVWLQERLAGDGSTHWYDAVAAVVYSTHFVSFPLVTAIVWFCLRDRFTAWITAVLTLTVVGVAGYVVYPATPPWIASDRGEIGAVARISTPGWDYLHLDVVGGLIVRAQEGSNPVAAMPSLHAASALLVALFLWSVVNARWRAVLLGYAVLMALTLVYTGEHYAVDVAVGWVVAVIAVVAGSGLHRRRAGGYADDPPRSSRSYAA